MRCQPGDLAIYIKSDFPENIGVVVEIVSPCNVAGHDWWVESARPHMTSIGPRTTSITVDSFMLPIRPQSDEATETEDDLEMVE